MNTEKTIRAALKKHLKATQERDEAIAKSVPVGSLIEWEPRKGACATGYVEMISGDRLRVRNRHTNKLYWIYAYCVTDILRPFKEQDQ